MELEDLETQDPYRAAAVAIELVKQARTHPGIKDRKPGVQVYYAISLLPTDNCGMVRLALHSLACYLGIGFTSMAWLHVCQQRARDGHNFRAVFHWQYKANRGLTPRITNRGGQLPGSPTTVADGATLDTGEQRDVADTESDRRDRLDQRNATERRLRLSDLARG